MNNFKVTVDGTYAVNFMNQVLTVKVNDGVAVSRESEIEAKLAIAVEALEFYADLDSWKSSVSGDYIIDRIRYDDLETKHFNMSNPSVGGKKARQALEKLRADTSR